MNETPFCDRCGESRKSVYASQVMNNENRHLELMALCGDCMDALKECPDCGQRFRGRGRRCSDCREPRGWIDSKALAPQNVRVER